jgi:hypothetical protein
VIRLLVTANVVPSSQIIFTLMIEAIRYSEMSVLLEMLAICVRDAETYIARWLWFTNQYCCLLHVAARTADVVRSVGYICMRDVSALACNPLLP